MTKPVVALILAGVLCALTALSPAPSLAQASGGDETRRAVDVDMDAAATLTADGIRKVQLALQKRGINPGPIDGILGPVTKEAVRTFQERYGIKANGELNNQTLFALGEPDLAA